MSKIYWSDLSPLLKFAVAGAVVNTLFYILIATLIIIGFVSVFI